MISKQKLLWIFLSTTALLTSTSPFVSGLDDGLCEGESLSISMRDGNTLTSEFQCTLSLYCYSLL